MYSAVVPPGIPSPTLPPSSASGLQRASDQGPASPAYEAYRDGGTAGTGGNVAVALAQAYSRSSHGDTTKAQTAASLAYAARLQEGFPFGISGVPTVPSYSYSSEMYNYVSNGFPRKSRICTYCNKLFTRSTTRRYHEKRCPLLRAAGSLMKGTAGASLGPAPTSNGDSSDATSTRGNLSRPPPLIAVTTESPSPPALPMSTSMSSSATSAGPASLARPHTLNSSQFYSMYGSPTLPTTVSTSSASLATRGTAAPLTSAPSSVDQNRNSVLPALKQEAEQEGGESGLAAQSGSGSKESDMLRDTKVTCQGEGSGLRQQHPMFSPLSTNSGSPSGSRSDEEDRESDEGEHVPFKSPSCLTVKPDSDFYLANSTYLSSPAVKQFYLAQLASLRASQGVAVGTDAPFFPARFAGKTDASSEKAAAEAPTEQQYSSDREEGSVRDGDSSYREEDDTDQHSYSQVAMETDEADDAEEKRKCSVCKMEFDLDTDLSEHERAHQRYKPNSCRYCGQRFIKPSMRIAHQRLHTSDFSFGCVVCGMEVLSKFGLRQHVHREHYNPSVGDTPCRYCESTIESVYDLRRHFHSHRHHVPKSERLSISFLPSPLPTLSESPMEEEASQERPPPSIDSKTSQDSPVEVPSEPPPLLGPIAPLPPPATEGSPSKVNDTSESGGGSREKEWCRICEKEFPKSFMRYHEREHADQKPYECPLCKKRFGYKNNMKSHMKLHAGIKPYQCQICFAKFTRGSTLRRHARRHGFTGDSLWDLFVAKSGGNMRDRGRELLLNQAASHDAAMTAAKSQSQGSPPVAGSRAVKADPALMASLGKADMMAVSKSYDLRGYPSSSQVTQSLFNTYPNLPQSVTKAMFQPYMAAQQYLGYATGFSPTAPPPPMPQQEVQSDALDFSMPEKQRRRNSSSSSVSAQGPPSSLAQAPGMALLAASVSRSPSDGAGDMVLPTSRGENQEMSRTEEVERNRVLPAEPYPQRQPANLHQHQPSAHHLHQPKQRASLVETVERLMESRSGGEVAVQPSRSHDFGTQVTLCCSRHGEKPRQGDTGGSQLTPSSSPGKSLSSHEGMQHESMASLITSGRLFCCPHCDCYFRDYAMYHIHQKVHLPDQPFVCFICQEDCLDKTSFSEHLLSHLR